MEEKEVIRRAKVAVNIALGPARLPEDAEAKLVREIATEIRRAYADGLTDSLAREK